MNRNLGFSDIQLEDRLVIPDRIQDGCIYGLNAFPAKKDHVEMDSVIVLEPERVIVIIDGIQKEHFIRDNPGGGIF